MNKSLFYRAVLTPSVVWLSVLFGAASGTGREMVEFITPAGAWGGIVAIAVIGLIFAVTFFLCFELSRLFKAYDYQRLSMQLLGKFWPLYEVAILVAMISSLAIVSSASGQILLGQFELPVLWGVGGMLAIIIAFTYYGRVFIEKTMALTSALLFMAFIYIGVQVAGNDDMAVGETFANSELHFDGVQKGLLYAFVNMAFIPLIIYAGRDIRSRGESAIGAVCAGIIGILPLLFLHSIFSPSYPEIRDVEMPTFWLLERISPDWFIGVYVVVVFFMFVQTGVGMMQGFLERMDGWYSSYYNKPMSRLKHSMLSFVMIMLSLLLSTIGFVELVRNAYSVLFYSFILTFTIPLFTVGVYKVYKGGGSQPSKGRWLTSIVDQKNT